MKLVIVVIFSLFLSAAECWKPILDLVIFIDTGVKIANTPSTATEYVDNSAVTDTNNSALIDTNNSATASTTTTTDDLLEVIGFCRNFSLVFEHIGPDGTQLGLITFDAKARIDLHWTNCSNATYAKALDKIANYSATIGTGNVSNLTTAISMYDNHMTYDKPGWNYVLIILRADFVDGDASVANTTFAKNTDLIVVDYRSEKGQSYRSLSDLFGSRVDLALSSVDGPSMTEIGDYIKHRECQYRLQPGKCHYRDPQRSICVQAMYVPADKYGGECNGSITENEQMVGNSSCSPSECDRTCDTDWPWDPVCEQEECGWNYTRYRHGSLPDARLGNCLNVSEIYCACHVEHLDPAYIKTILGVRIAFFVGFFTLALIMVSFRLIERREIAMSSPKKGIDDAKLPKSTHRSAKMVLQEKVVTDKL